MRDIYQNPAPTPDELAARERSRELKVRLLDLIHIPGSSITLLKYDTAKVGAVATKTIFPPDLQYDPEGLDSAFIHMLQAEDMIVYDGESPLNLLWTKRGTRNLNPYNPGGLPLSAEQAHDLIVAFSGSNLRMVGTAKFGEDFTLVVPSEDAFDEEKLADGAERLGKARHIQIFPANF